MRFPTQIIQWNHHESLLMMTKSAHSAEWVMCLFSTRVQIPRWSLAFYHLGHFRASTYDNPRDDSASHLCISYFNFGSWPSRSLEKPGYQICLVRRSVGMEMTTECIWIIDTSIMIVQRRYSWFFWTKTARSTSSIWSAAWRSILFGFFGTYK